MPRFIKTILGKKPLYVKRNKSIEIINITIFGKINTLRFETGIYQERIAKFAENMRNGFQCKPIDIQFNLKITIARKEDAKFSAGPM
jgi:hypothetical protein